MTDKRILVVGTINMDVVLRTPRFPAAGETMPGEDLRLIPGGKGANQAVAVARLGLPVLFAGRVGGDSFGATLLQGLKSNGVDTSWVVCDPEAASGTALILVEPDGRNTIVFASGANGRFSLQSAAEIQKVLPQVDLVLLQLELPLESVARVIAGARSAGKPVVLDAGPPCPRPLPEFFQVTVLSPNESEAEALTGMSIRDPQGAARAARLLLARGPEMVVLKLGTRGAMLAARGIERYFPAFQVRAVDTTAAGDAFTAALSVALVEGRDPEEAVRRANAAGALASTRIGAQPSMPTLKELERFLETAC